MRKIQLFIFCAALATLTGCKKEEKQPPVKSTEAKTSYGQAVAAAKNAAKSTEDAHRREIEAALDDEEPGER